MDVSSQEGEIDPIPISSSAYAHMNIHHHHQQQQQQQQNHNNNNINGSPNPITATPTPTPGENEEIKKVHTVSVRYRECLKNHAAAMGGNATDGCGEFMPSGEEGSLEALKCSACNCHRNFHRKEIQAGDHHHQSFSASCTVPDCNYHHLSLSNKMMSCRTINPHHKHMLQLGSRAAAVVPNQMIMPYSLLQQSESDEQEARPHHQQALVVKKRFRTKFTPEQKEKMLNFAEKVGWRIQKQEGGVVQQFCQEIGVKRRVLKVWMHNNKHNLSKKIINSSSINNSQPLL